MISWMPKCVFERVMTFSVALSSLFTVIGLWLSYLFNLTSGATIILVAAFFFFASLLIDRLRKQRNLPLP